MFGPVVLASVSIHLVYSQILVSVYLDSLRRGGGRGREGVNSQAVCSFPSDRNFSFFGAFPRADPSSAIS